jgi:hypothetical protein
MPNLWAARLSNASRLSPPAIAKQIKDEAMDVDEDCRMCATY